MPCTIEIVPFQGWQRNLRLANDHVELIATLEIGPRIISYAPKGGASVFKVYEDQAGGTGEAEWQIRGGHRLWLAPEVMPFTYFPDNDPVQYEQLAANAIRLTPPPETINGYQKQIDITLDENSSRVSLLHRITNIATTAQTHAPWSLSVMAPGGVEIIPQPPLGEHPGLTAGDFSANRTMILWPFSDLSDPRWHLGRDFITLRQDAGRGPTKMGLAHQVGWVAYYLKGTLFVKRFRYDANATYADRGSNFETFTNEDMLEVETLGPLQTLQPGQSMEHREEWQLHTGVPAFASDRDSEIAAAINRFAS